MKNNNRVQAPKKRSTAFLIIFIILLIPTLIIVAEKSKELLSSLSFASKATVKKESRMPAKLKWFDSFGDINK